MYVSATKSNKHHISSSTVARYTTHSDKGPDLGPHRIPTLPHVNANITPACLFLKLGSICCICEGDWCRCLSVRQRTVDQFRHTTFCLSLLNHFLKMFYVNIKGPSQLRVDRIAIFINITLWSYFRLLLNNSQQRYCERKMMISL